MKKKKSKNKMGEIDYGIFYAVILLLAVGIVMVYSASSYYAMFKNNDSMFYLKRQLIFAPLGIGTMCFMMSYDYHKIKKYTFALMIATIPLLLAVYSTSCSNVSMPLSLLVTTIFGSLQKLAIN